jgi:hypothetical protein
VAVPVAALASLPPGERRDDCLHEQGGRAEIAGNPLRDRQERVQHACRDGDSGEDQRQPQRCARDLPGEADAGHPAGAAGTAYLAVGRQPADHHYRYQASNGRHGRGDAGQVVSGEPDPGGQRDYGRNAGDEAEQAEPLAAAPGRQQFRGERAGDHAAQAEAEPAHQADAHHDGLGLAHQHGQGRRAEQQRADRKHWPVAESPDRCCRGRLGNYGAEQQRPGGDPSAGAAGAGCRRQHRHHRQQQEEASQRGELGQERGCQRRAEEPVRGGGIRLRLRQGAHSSNVEASRPTDKVQFHGD